MKDLKDLERNVVLSRVETVRNVLAEDKSQDSKLTLLENAISIVGINKESFGKVTNLSSLEQNRIALGLISSLQSKQPHYTRHQSQQVLSNMKAYE